jgi:diaminopimelate decarboxylase
MLRLATGGDAEGTPIIGGAGNAKFGLIDEEADEAISRLRASGSLAPSGPYVVRGFHAFGASNVLDDALLVDGVVRLAARAHAIAHRHDLPIEVLDGGGGLGIPYTDADHPLDLIALGRGLYDEMATWRDRGPLRDTRLLLEPGRWLVGPAGAYICRVTRAKIRDGRHIAVSDGGIHHLLRPRLVGQDHRVVAVGAMADRTPDASVDLVGPLCTGLDFVATAVVAPAPRAGDLLAVLDAGAYGYSESMPLFLTHPTPAEILVSGGQVTVSRERLEPL